MLDSFFRSCSSFVLWILAWSLATAGIFLAHARPASSQLDEDEIYWIGSAYYFHLFCRGDWKNADWHLLPARENPPLAKYVIGLGLAGSGRTVSSPDLLGTFYLIFERVPGAWGRGEDYAKRKAVVERMNPEFRDAIRRGANPQMDASVLVASRRTMVVCAVLLSFLVFVAASWTQGPLSGLIASALLCLHPAVIRSYNHALSDIVALLFSAAAAAAVFSFSQSLFSDDAPAWRGSLLKAASAGVLTALACSAKMNSLVVLLLAGVVVGWAIFTHGMCNPSRGWHNTACGMVLLAIALAVFALLDPTILTDPVGGLIASVREHHLTESVQATFLHDHLESLWQKFSATARLVCFSPPIFVVLVIGAVVAMRSKKPALRFAALWFLIATICVTEWIPFPRDRYVLPVVLPASLLIAFIVTSLFGNTVSKLLAGIRSALPFDQKSRPPAGSA